MTNLMMTALKRVEELNEVDVSELNGCKPIKDMKIPE